MASPEEGHSESELRGMITSAAKTLEDIAYRCVRSGFQVAGEQVLCAVKALQCAKFWLVVEAQRKEQAE